MTVTYKEIRERQEQLNTTRNERINRVISEAVTLVKMYVESLQLENSTWKDIQGVEQPYVFTGVMSNGEFTKTPLTDIEVDNNYGLDFYVCTVTDDSPRGGQSSMLNIYLYIEGGVVKVGLPDSGKTIPVIDGNCTQVCDAMKDHVLMSIRDFALEDTKYF